MYQGRVPFCVLALCLLQCGCTRVVSRTSAIQAMTFTDDDAKNRPVSKVIEILKSMLKDMETDAEKDEEIFNKMACWCETNEKEKTQNIENSESRITVLTTQIEELTGKSARLNTEIASLNREVAANENALDTATGIRTKELAEFTAAEKDMLASINGLKQAVIVLNKHNSASFLDIAHGPVRDVANTLQQEMQAHQELLEDSLSDSQRQTVQSFIQRTNAPQSGEIFGILKQMKETFQTNLAKAQKDEAAGLQAYEELKAAKEEEIQAGKDQSDSKTEELAAANEKNANSKDDLESTQESLAADEKFMGVLKEKCSMSDGEWEQRQKTRQLEMEAVSKALAIISGEEAHALFTDTFNPSFLQKASSNAQRMQAWKVLSAAATKLQSPALALIATSARMDAFVKVKESIDRMIKNLKKEGEDEIKHKDFCIEEFDKNEIENQEKNHDKKKLVAVIEDLDGEIDTLKRELDELNKQVKESTEMMKVAGEDRERANTEFQTEIANQRATQKILQKALDSLKSFYGFVQSKQDPPAGFSEYKKNEKSTGVMGMMQGIIDESKEMEAELIRAEEDGQKSYEDLVKETNSENVKRNELIVEKSELMARRKEERVQNKENLDAVNLELEQLHNRNADLHGSCDFVLKNFEVRQTARADEIKALDDAKAIFSGGHA